MRMPNNNGGKAIGCFVILFAIAFVGAIGAAIVGGFWNYSLYKECIADGKKAYQCKAMLDGNSRYIAVDDVSDN